MLAHLRKYAGRFGATPLGRRHSKSERDGKPRLQGVTTTKGVGSGHKTRV